MTTGTEPTLSTDSRAHTPGPWIVLHLNYRAGARAPLIGIDDQKGNPIVHWSGFDAASFGPANLQNARLMAAAPDLLAALKAMDESLCCGYETPETRLTGRKALIAARAAIAKAEGRS